MRCRSRHVLARIPEMAGQSDCHEARRAVAAHECASVFGRLPVGHCTCDDAFTDTKMMKQDAAVDAPVDPGLQGERTSLAWTRTGLAIMVNGLLVVRAGWSTDQRALTVLGSLLGCAGLATFFYGAHRGRRILSGICAAQAAVCAVSVMGGLAFACCVVAGAIAVGTHPAAAAGTWICAGKGSGAASGNSLSGGTRNAGADMCHAS